MSDPRPHSPRCPETGLACTTAYPRGCRCDPCRAHSAAVYQRKQAALRAEALSIEIDPGKVPHLERLWSVAEKAFMVDLNYLADMMEASVPIAKRRE